MGSFALPFSTLYREGRIEGIFRIETPPLNFGYDHKASLSSQRQDRNASMFVSDEVNDPAGPDALGNRVIQSHRPMNLCSMIFQLFELFDSKEEVAPPDRMVYHGSYIHYETQVTSPIYSKPTYTHLN